MKNKKGKIKVSKNGPYLVRGGLKLSKDIIIADENGDSFSFRKGQSYDCGSEYALCRCGQSKNKPFCDSSHIKAGFKGEETASLEDFSTRCEKIKGKRIDLYDLPELCARARFCHNQKGDIWSNVEDSGNKETEKEAIRKGRLCPSGRLVIKNRETGKTEEPSFEQEIGLIEDPEKKVSGPIWAKGGVEIESAEGKKYEKRNRTTLCRCGKSDNKPFCNGCHIEERFNDGDESLK